MAAEADRTLNNVGERVEITLYRLNDFASRFEREVQIENRRARFNDGASAKRFTRYNTHCYLSIRRMGGGNPACRNFLIMRADHFVGLRQVHPELHAVKRSSGPLKFLRRLFGVNNTAAGRHPLNVARLELSFVPLRVLVPEAAGQHIGHCFKASMWMIRSALRLSRPDLHWTHFVEQEEWIEIR